MHRSLSTYCPPLRGPPPEGYLPWALATTTCLAAASSNLAEGWPTMCAVGGWSLKIWVPVQIWPDEVGYKWDYLSNIDILLNYDILRPSRPSYCSAQSFQLLHIHESDKPNIPVYPSSYVYFCEFKKYPCFEWIFMHIQNCRRKFEWIQWLCSTSCQVLRKILSQLRYFWGFLLRVVWPSTRRDLQEMEVP